MRNGKISRTQLMALLWAGTMAPAAELLPALLLPGAGRGAWRAGRAWPKGPGSCWGGGWGAGPF